MSRTDTCLETTRSVLGFLGLRWLRMVCILAITCVVSCVQTARMPKLSAAIARGELEHAMELLAQDADVRARDALGATALHYAVVNGFEKMARLLLEKGADPNAADKFGNTPLFSIAQACSNSTELCGLLLSSGARPDVLSNTKQSPLTTAISGHRNGAVALLLRHGVDIEMPTYDGRTALAVAAAECNCTVVDTLLSLGAAVECRDSSGYTPLMHAAMRSCDVSCVESLVRSGASTAARDSFGRTAVDIAVEQGNDSLLHFLRRLRRKDGPSPEAHAGGF